MQRSSLAAAMMLLFAISASAQNGAPPAAANNSAAVGDHWVYEVKDDISGEIKDTRTFTVTELSNNQIAVHQESAKSLGSNFFLYDQSWNVVRGPMYKFSPNDGSGIKFPLVAGAQWKISIDSTNLNNGQNWKRIGSAKVTGQEKITTKAGTFDTFVIEKNIAMKNAANPTQNQEVVIHTWYNSEINHWVKRSFVVRQSGHLFQSETMELISYGRKKT